jgi:NAD(P)-dependent dehydrogenase (short-subunit alcohol dehydrogenase family)
VAAIDASSLLRPGLLEHASVLVAPGSDAGDPEGSLAEAVRSGCAALGARVSVCGAIPDACSEDQEAAMDAAVSAALGELERIDALVVDAAALFAPDAGSGGAREALIACLDAVWTLTRSVFNLALLSGGRGGRIVYLAPAPHAGEHAEPARAGLENLSRTLSIEWARHEITVVTIAPGRATAAKEAAALAAYLASPAGAYFSGCLLDLRGPAR